MSAMRGWLYFLVAVLILGLLGIVMGGCTSWSRETQIEEGTYQVLSAIDTVQSTRAARDPSCYAESSFTTRAVIGEHPSPQAAIGWGVSRAGIHAAITGILEAEDADRWVRRAWQAIGIGVEGKVVRQNWVIGLHIGSADPPAYAPCLQRKRPRDPERAP